MKKKYIVAFLATLFFIFAIPIITLVLAQPATAAPTADSFGVEDASGGAGAYVEVPVSITNVMNGPVQCIRLRVDYNESVLNLTNIGNGDLTSNWTHLQLGKDRHTVVIAATHSGDAIQNGSSGSVMLLNFHVIGSPGDTSPVNMILIELSNPEGGVGRTAPARNRTFTVTHTTTPTPSNGGSGDGGDGGGGRGYVPPTPTPTPTEKPLAVEEVAATPSPTLAPTIAPAPTPAQTPAPAIPAAQVPVMRWFMILIAIFIAIIVIAGIIIIVMRR